MLTIPKLDDGSIAFGDIRHMPKYDTIPKEFKRHRGNDYCKAISSWFFSGAKRDGDALIIDGMRFEPRAGVNADEAIRAIKAVLGSWEPKHEHKEAACAFMLSEWFEKK